jgi:hypothetical protein
MRRGPLVAIIVGASRGVQTALGSTLTQRAAPTVAHSPIAPLWITCLRQLAACCWWVTRTLTTGRSHWRSPARTMWGWAVRRAPTFSARSMHCSRRSRLRRCSSSAARTTSTARARARPFKTFRRSSAGSPPPVPARSTLVPSQSQAPPRCITSTGNMMASSWRTRRCSPARPPQVQQRCRRSW